MVKFNISMHITLNIYIPKQKKIPDFGTKDQFIKYEYHCYSSCPCAPSTSSRKQFKHFKNKQKVFRFILYDFLYRVQVTLNYIDNDKECQK